METMTLVFLLFNTILLVCTGVLVSQNTRKNSITYQQITDYMAEGIRKNHIPLPLLFSPAVIELYGSILSEPQKWGLTEFLLKKYGDDIGVWAANDLSSRRFYTHNEKLIPGVDELNKQLTHWDQVLLDKIIRAFHENSNQIHAKIFI